VTASTRARSCPATMLRTTLDEYLYLDDPWVVDVVLATIVANTQGGDPLWLLLVNPASTGKTELVQIFANVPTCAWLSQVSENTFLSGLQQRKKSGGTERAPKNSLLFRWTDPKLRGGQPPVRVMLIQDLTTMVTMHREKRDAILGQLREIYDGRLVKSTGMGEDMVWTGYLGLLGAVTIAIDTVLEQNSILGERFILYRPVRRDADAEARFAMNRAVEGDWRAGLAAVAEVMVTRGVARLADVVVPEDVRDRLVDLARFTAAGRTKVERDGSKVIRVMPEAEGPARLTQQFGKLLTGLCAVRGCREPGPDQLAVIAKTALDSMPKLRRVLLSVLVGLEEGTAEEIAAGVRLPRMTVTYALQDLQALGIVDRRAGAGDSDRTARWALEPVYRELADRTELFAETPETRPVTPRHTHTEIPSNSPINVPLTTRVSEGAGGAGEGLAAGSGQGPSAGGGQNGSALHADRRAATSDVLRTLISNSPPWGGQS
jgi:DNA-binding transcriptional ArsR family regulator/predicted protein tyrosine phosphatase